MWCYGEGLSSKGLETNIIETIGPLRMTMMNDLIKDDLVKTCRLFVQMFCCSIPFNVEIRQKATKGGPKC